MNMAPGTRGERLAMEEVGERIVQWLQNGTPLPPEWDGTPLKTLVCIHLPIRQTKSSSVGLIQSYAGS